MWIKLDSSFLISIVCTLFITCWTDFIMTLFSFFKIFLPCFLCCSLLHIIIKDPKLTDTQCKNPLFSFRLFLQLFALCALLLSMPFFFFLALECLNISIAFYLAKINFLQMINKFLLRYTWPSRALMPQSWKVSFILAIKNFLILEEVLLVSATLFFFP